MCDNLANILDNKYVNWFCTFCLIISALLTGLNIFPLNIIITSIGGIGFTIIMYSRKDWPLFTVNFVMTLLYNVGWLIGGI